MHAAASDFVLHSHDKHVFLREMEALRIGNSTVKFPLAVFTNAIERFGMCDL